MVILAPTTDEQEFNVLPRDPEILSGLTLVIVEEDSKQTQTISNPTVFENGDKITVSAAFTILNENKLYKISITDEDGNNWWRGKARVTAQSDFTQKHSLNTIASDGYIVLTDDETFTELL